MSAIVKSGLGADVESSAESAPERPRAVHQAGRICAGVTLMSGCEPTRSRRLSSSTEQTRSVRRTPGPKVN
jgi:hypothetical protein